MDLTRWLARTRAIQSIPSPTFQEEARAVLLESEFHSAALCDVQVDPTGNVFGRLPGGSAPPLIVSAHLDTVFPMQTDLALREAPGRLVGPGVGDNAVALAALVELALDGREATPAGDVWFVANTGEEGLGNLSGMRAVVSRFGAGVSGYVVLEGMALGHVYHRGLPSRRYRVTARSAGGHSWIHAGRPSAIHDLLAFGAEVLRLPRAEGPKLALNIGRIEGGTSVNTIAGEAHFELDVRSEDEPTLAMLENRLRGLIPRVDGAGKQLSVEQIGARPAGGLPFTHPLVMRACAALEQAGEGPPKLGCASTDASYPLSLGLPAICVGLTSGGEAHTLQEYIELEPLPRGYASVAALIAAAFEV